MRRSDDDKIRTNISLTSDTMVSRYRIIDKTGAGGMGEVYLTEDTELNCKIALKFLSSYLCQDEEHRARCRCEAQGGGRAGFVRCLLRQIWCCVDF